LPFSLSIGSVCVSSSFISVFFFAYISSVFFSVYHFSCLTKNISSSHTKKVKCSKCDPSKRCLKCLDIFFTKCHASRQDLDDFAYSFWITGTARNLKRLNWRKSFQWPKYLSNKMDVYQKYKITLGLF
jgi:hypothetical protein